jgi:hypothetical protein
VDRLRRRRRFVRLRRHTAARAAALFLITLILLPFTAPFPTCELTHSSHSDPFDTPAKAKLGTDDTLEVPLSAVCIGVRATLAALTDVTGATEIVTHPPKHTILRI